MRIPMIAAIDLPQALIMNIRHRRLITLKGAAGILPISQSRNIVAVTRINAGTRIMTRSDFIPANFTAAPMTIASSRAT
jgi:hypothetical protein